MRLSTVLVSLWMSIGILQAETTVRIIPPTGATFAPGQRFDVRLEASDIQGPPQNYVLTVNGADRTREVFGTEKFATFPLLDESGRATAQTGGGVTRRDWSVRQAGPLELKALYVDSTGKRFETISRVSIVDPGTAARTARNVILFVGDGMGVAQRTAARVASKGMTGGRANGRLEMDQFEANGFVMTSSLDSIVTDSSPGAAGYATGNKAINNTHGVYPDNTGPRGGLATSMGTVGEGMADFGGNINAMLMDNPRVENVAELLKRSRGMSTGIVTTVAVTDSTPSAFTVHTFSRYIHGAIADHMLDNGGHDVILGGGTRGFVPTGNALLGGIAGRTDTRNVVDEFKKAGYTFVSNAAELQAAGKPKRLMGLFHPIDLTGRYDRMRARKGDPQGKEAAGRFPDQPDLELMLSKALEVLSQNPKGFFLLVEGGSVDREYHRTDPHRAIFETIELDRAIGLARKWSAARGNDTLIVVTADHETSGLALVGVQTPQGTYATRAFPNYADKDGDGFPDELVPSAPIAFDFASRFRPGPAETNHVYPRARNLSELNPEAPDPPDRNNPPSAGHTFTDVFIAATGPGAPEFGRVMDSTEVFFKMLQAVGYKPR